MITFRCATSNLGNCGEWSHPNKIAHFVQSIERDLKRPEIIALQEIGAEISDHNPNLNAIIADDICNQLNANVEDQTRHYHYIEIPPLPNSSGGEPAFNIRCGYLYRAPIIIERVENIGTNESAFIGDEMQGYRPSRFPLALFATLFDRELLLINCHLKSMNSQNRDEERIAKEQRNQQMEIIYQYCHQHRTLPTLILGDFNDTPGSDTLKIATKDNIFSPIYCYTSRSTYTYRHRTRPLVLDYILYNPLLNFCGKEIIHLNTNLANQNRYSDHDPVLATFTL